MAKFTNHDLSLNTCVGKQARPLLSFTGQKLLFSFEIEKLQNTSGLNTMFGWFYVRELRFFFTLLSDSWQRSLWFFFNGFKMERKVPKGQKWIKLCTWAGEGNPGLLWNSFSRFSTSVLSSWGWKLPEGWMSLASHFQPHNGSPGPASGNTHVHI